MFKWFTKSIILTMYNVVSQSPVSEVTGRKEGKVEVNKVESETQHIVPS